eukprot:scaffold25438_cov97-Skeletonema_dohrnii-CCMP3373.AAC.3
MECSLRNRWNSSVTCLIMQLGMSSSSTITIDRERLQALDALSQSWLEKISQLYAEPHRAYHNMTHVQDVIASLDFLLDGLDSSIAPTTREVAILILAAFFHDVIYNPKSSTNEKDSADLFLQFASELMSMEISTSSSQQGDSTSDDNDEQPCTQQHIRNCIMVKQIEECIIATATHISSAETAHETQNHMLATFLDADMSILGKDVETYDKYAGYIRREYEFVERNMYCEKRADILESFLPILDEDAASTTAATPVKKHSFIYATEKARQQWEEQARSNLKNEIEMLRRGVIPCEIQKHG